MCMFVNVFQEDIIISWKHWGMGYRSMVEYLVCVKSWAQLVYLLRNTVNFSIFCKSLPPIFIKVAASFKHLLTAFYLFLIMCVPGEMCMWVQVLSELTDATSPWGWSWRQLWVIWYSCWEQNSGPPQTVRTLNCWVISLALTHLDQLGTDIIFSWLSVQLTVKLLLNSDMLFLVALLYNYWIVPLDRKAVTKYTFI